MKTKILAHRGSHLSRGAGENVFAPENTLEAFRLGIEQGADGIELDVHLSKDGEVMVFHDLTLERMTGEPGRICDFTAEELKRLDFPIPTLDEVYGLINGLSITRNRPFTVNVELKTTEEVYPSLPAKLLDLQDRIGPSKIIYSSFNHYSLMDIRRIDPCAYIGLLYNLPLVDPYIYAQRLGANAIHPPWQIIAALPNTVDDCHTLGIEVNVWTVNDEAYIRKMLACGVDTVITDKPDVAVAQLNHCGCMQNWL
ncbi:MAG: glycerophosphodiester phosphodiesterase [Defluviitaleaceae bacterium]|nr:glycerophosphodiester phosphodiesterase [Defluviitaleaceae bacterium]